MILFRADANKEIGTGHVMRCLSIAKGFNAKGEKVLFITADHNGDELIKQNGFQSLCLESNWKAMDDEIDIIKYHLSQMHPSILVVDSYFVTQKYFSEISNVVKVVYIDDFNKEMWNVDTLINYNIYSQSLDYSIYNDTRTELILSPKYAPLRDEFKSYPPHNIKKVTDVMVSAGGSDPQKITERLMNNVCDNYPDIDFHFIVGALNPRLDTIKNISQNKANIVLHINEKNMSALMNKCDIAISAAGTTLYELCACGIPTITYTLADNQLMAAEQFSNKEIMLSVGDCRNDDSFISRVEKALCNLVEDMELRKTMSNRMHSLVDGNGVERIIEKLLK